MHSVYVEATDIYINTTMLYPPNPIAAAARYMQLDLLDYILPQDIQPYQAFREARHSSRSTFPNIEQLGDAVWYNETAC